MCCATVEICPVRSSRHRPRFPVLKQKALKFRRQTPNTGYIVYKKMRLHSITKKLVPKHPRTAEFVAQGLYAVNSFKELEAKISALECKDERGAAFEVFAEAFF